LDNDFVRDAAFDIIPQEHMRSYFTHARKHTF